MFNQNQQALLNPLGAIAGTLAPNQEDQQSAQSSMLGQLAMLALAAGQRQTAPQRAAMIAQAAPVIGGYQQGVMNAAQSRLMQAKATQEQQELERQNAMQERLNDPAFVRGLGLTPEQAVLFGPQGALKVAEARAAHDPLDAAYKMALIKKLAAGDTGQWQVVGQNEFGQNIYGYPPAPGAAPSGSPTQLPGGGSTAPGTGGAAPQQSGSILDQIGDATGPAALEKLQRLNPTIAAEVRSIVQGNQPFPPRMMGTPHGAMLNALVSVVDPNYNAGTYKQRNDTRSDFQKSSPSSAGGQRQFGNVGLKHMLEIYNLADKLPNHTNWGPLNTTVNQIDIRSQEKSGQGGPITSYKLAVINGFDEIAKALGIGTGAGQQELQEKLSAAQGPAAIKQVIREQAKLLKEKLDTLQERYGEQMGPAAGNYRVIDPEAEKALNLILGEANGENKAPASPSIPGVRSIRQIQ